MPTPLQYAHQLSDDYLYGIDHDGQSNSRPWGHRDDEGFVEAEHLKNPPSGIDLTIQSITPLSTFHGDVGSQSLLVVAENTETNFWIGATLRLHHINHGRTDSITKKGHAKVITNGGRQVLVQWESESPSVLVVADGAGAYDLTNDRIALPSHGLVTGSVLQFLSGTLATCTPALALNTTYTVVNASTGCTVTHATPGVVTWAGHKLPNDARVRFTLTTGRLPTALKLNVDYYVRNRTETTFELSATVGGSSISTASGGGFGVHTIYAVDHLQISNVPTPTAVTISSANPGVVTWNGHGLVNGQAVIYTTTGSVAGLTNATTYFVANAAANTFNLEASIGGGAIDTTGAQSGTHTLQAVVNIQTAPGGGAAGAHAKTNRTEARLAGYLVHESKWYGYDNIRVLTPYQPEQPGDYPSGAPQVPGYDFATVASYEDCGLLLPYAWNEGIDGHGHSGTGATVAGLVVTVSGLDSENKLAGGMVLVGTSWARIVSHTATAITVDEWRGGQPAASPTTHEWEAFCPHWRDNPNRHLRGFRYPSNDMTPGGSGVGDLYNRAKGKLGSGYKSSSWKVGEVSGAVNATGFAQCYSRANGDFVLEQAPSGLPRISRYGFDILGSNPAEASQVIQFHDFIADGQPVSIFGWDEESGLQTAEFVGAFWKAVKVSPPVPKSIVTFDSVTQRVIYQGEHGLISLALGGITAGAVAFEAQAGAVMPAGLTNRRTYLVADVLSAVAITNASPGVVTWVGHALPANTPVKFTTGGSVSGLVNNTTYYVANPTADTFELSATPGGGSIDTSGTQSGVHSLRALDRHGITNTDASAATFTNNGSGSIFAYDRGSYIELDQIDLPVSGINYAWLLSKPGTIIARSFRRVNHRMGSLVECAWQLANRLGKTMHVVHLGINSASQMLNPNNNDFLYQGQIGWLDDDNALSWTPSAENGLFARWKRLHTHVLPGALRAMGREPGDWKCLAGFTTQGEGDALDATGREIYHLTMPAFHAAKRQVWDDIGANPYADGAKIPIVHKKITHTPWELTGNVSLAYYGGVLVEFDGDGDGLVNAAIDAFAADPENFAATFQPDPDDRYDLTKLNGATAFGIDLGHYNGTYEVRNGLQDAEAAITLIEYALSFGLDEAQALQVANLALGHLGEFGGLTSLATDDATVPQQLAAQAVPLAWRQVLELAAWPHATKAATLPLLEETVSPWAYAYRLPPDLLTVQAVMPPGSTRVDHELAAPHEKHQDAEGRFVLLTNLADAVVFYTTRARTRRKPSAQFLAAVSWKVASLLAGPVIKGSKGTEEARRAEQRMVYELSIAAANEQNQSHQVPEHRAPWHRRR